MTKAKYIIILVLVSLGLLWIPNEVNAAVEVTKDNYTNTGSMKFNFTGLELSKDKDYEYGFTKTAAETVQDWYLIKEHTESTATIDLIITTKQIRDVINASDTGYITIREKENEDGKVLEPYAVDLKMPYILVTNSPVLLNGTEMGVNETECINVPIRNAANSQAYYQYEKITDQNIIDKYKEVKTGNGDIMELQNLLTTKKPGLHWTSWAYWNGHEAFGKFNGFGYPQKIITAPDTGLYYLWVYFSGDNIKDVYGYIIVDNLQSGDTNSGNNTGVNNKTTGTTTSNNKPDGTTATKILPKTGIQLGVGLFSIALVVGIGILSYFKHKRLKGI